MTPPAGPISSIRLRPVGAAAPLEYIDELAADLAGIFRVSCHVAAEPFDASFAFDKQRGQYYSTSILVRLAGAVALEPGDRILGVTDLDLYVPVLTFVFGEAQVGGNSALVSLCRLRDEFYGLPPAPELLRERAAKEAVHELGHTLGLRHCANWQCVMASTHAVERLDLKLRDFCPACKRAAHLGPTG